jgi:hypothetical protein
LPPFLLGLGSGVEEPFPLLVAVKG